MIYLRLFLEFFKTGLFSIGGGLATLPFLYDISARTGWFTSGDISNMIAISESTPGALGINMSTYAGYVSAGHLGGVIATLGLITPSVLVILVIARLLTKFQSNPYVERAFYGLRPASVALIAAAGVNVAGTALFHGSFPGLESLPGWISWKAVALGLVIYFGQKITKWHPVIFIGIAGIAGILFHFAG